MASLAKTLRRGRRRTMFLALLTMMRVAGFAGARPLGRFFGDLQWWLGGAARRRMTREMAVAMGRPADDAQAAALLHEAFRVNTAAVLEILAMFDRPLDERMLASQCEVEGIERLQAALAGGRGAILLATHAGNSVLVAMRLARSGLPVSVVFKHARMMSADFLQKGMSLYGIDGILANEGIKAYGRMLSALKQGRIVFVMMDQGVRSAKDGIELPFLGKRVAMTAGPAQLARHARAPVLPVVTTASDPVWTFRIEDPVPRAEGSTLEDDVALFTRVTEQQVLRFPALWSWHHRRWKSAPPLHPA